MKNSLNMKKYHPSSDARFLCAFILMCLATSISLMNIDPAFADSTGRVDRAGDPASPGLNGDCTDCHFGGVAPVAILSGPASVTAGSINTYSFNITSGGTATVAGLNVASSDGVLALSATSVGMQVMPNAAGDDELTHTMPAVLGGSLTFDFDWTAPAVAGISTLYAAGLAGDGDGLEMGDGTATAIFVIDVTVDTAPLPVNPDVPPVNPGVPPVDPVAPPADPGAPPLDPGVPPPASDVAMLFMDNCGECHGPAGEGTVEAPAIVAASAEVIQDAIDTVEAMSGLIDVLTQDEIDAIADFLEPVDSDSVVVNSLGGRGANTSASSDTDIDSRNRIASSRLQNSKEKSISQNGSLDLLLLIALSLCIFGYRSLRIKVHHYL